MGRGLVSLDSDYLVSVVRNNWVQVLVISNESRSQFLFSVVRSLLKTRFNILRRRVELKMIDLAGDWVVSSSDNTLDEFLIRDIQHEHDFRGAAHGIESLGLNLGTGHTVQDPSLVSGFNKMFLDHSDDKVIRDKGTFKGYQFQLNSQTSVHETLSLLAQRSSSCNLSTQDVAGAQVGVAKLFFHKLSLSTLS